MGPNESEEYPQLSTRRYHKLDHSEKRPLIILGAGGHAKVLAEILIGQGHNILGLVTPNNRSKLAISGLSVLGDDDAISAFQPEEVLLVNGIGAIPGRNTRWKVAVRMRESGYAFANVIHPNAIIASDIKLSEGVQIMAGSVIQSGTQIGRNSIINTGVLVDHDCQINENCHLAPGVVCCGSVLIGEGCFVGAGATIIQNVTIGNNAIIAAGSIVNKNVAGGLTLIQKR